MVDARLSPPFGSDQYWVYFGKSPVTAIVDIIRHLILPVVTLVVVSVAGDSRFVRASMLEALGQDYVRTARAKGLPNRIVTFRHALRNALLPVVTVISLEFAFLIGGLVVTEQVFNLNGIGKLLVDAVAHRDYTLIQALVLLLAAVFVLINFVVDMVYVVLDPRIRYS
jgi:peptide/nickel transport system permease protein